MKKNLLILIFFPLLFACKPQYVRDFTPQTNFDALWRILDEKYCFFDDKDIDWNGVKAVYQPQLAKMKNEVQMFDLFAQMIDTLQDGHVNLYSQFDVSRCKGWFEDYPENFNAAIISQRYLGENYRVSGGFSYNLIDNKKIGYMRYSSFENAVSGAGMKYIREIFGNCKGIILDVRSNGGGSLSYSEALAACFLKEKTLTGYIRHKNGIGHNDFSAPKAVYTDPKDAPVDWSDLNIVILTNRRCYSATNDFICRIKNNAPNVVIVGRTTGGGGGVPSSNELPCGWMIRFSAVQLLDKNHNQIEFGIEPDFSVDLENDDVAEGKDTLIEYAVNLLKNK
ncbi:MAG: S41 family peptidase [Prevotellaceae bacterium]|nr:S41 family peptidase [Prevotellaceae bacterium]